MLKKVFLGSVVVMVMAFTTVIPALAQIPEEEVKVEGTVQSIDFVAGTFTILTEDGTEFTVDAPDGFDLNLLVLGTKVEAEGLTGLDNMVAAFEIELHDGSEFEVEDEAEDIDDDDAGDVEDDDAGDVEDDDDLDDDDQDDVDEDEQEDVDDDHGGDSGSDHEDDDDRSGSNSGSDHDDDSSDGEDD